MVKVSNTDATTAGEQKQHTDKVTRTKSGTFNYTDNLDCFDTEKQGFTMTPEVQTMWDQPPPAYLQLSKMTRFLHVVKHFPRRDAAEHQTSWWSECCVTARYSPARSQIGFRTTPSVLR
jgi:hypothetical protein